MKRAGWVASEYLKLKKIAKTDLKNGIFSKVADPKHCKKPRLI